MKLEASALRLSIFVGERIQNFLPELDELITEGMVIVNEVDVIHYISREHEGNVS